MPSDITPRHRGRAVVITLILAAIHVGTLYPAHHASSDQSLLIVGAYCGALGAFICAFGVASGWHLAGGHPRARLQHIFLTAWLTSAWGALIGGLVTLLAVRTGDSDSQRILGAALIAPGFSTLFAGRFSAAALVQLAERSSAAPALDGARARQHFALAGAAASLAFGGTHPWVRFPGVLPTGQDAFLYGAGAILTLVLLLPFAGWRLMRSVTTSGRVKKDATGGLLAPLAGAVATGVFGLVVLGVALPSAHGDWALWRATVGTLLGSCLFLAGASFRR